jgi:type I restriction enzyme S subunit
MRFRVDESQITNEFLEGYLRSSIVRKYIQSCASGTSGSMVKINKTVVEKIPVILPPHTEQKAIADLLSTWDKVIEKTERLIHAEEKRFKWLLRELISDQCVEQNQGSEWKSCRLGKFFVERNEKSTAHDQHPVLTSSRKGLFYQSDYFSKQVTSSDNEGYKIVNKGDFTYRAMSDDGKFAFNRLDFCNHGIISPAYGVFYPKNINSDFLLFYMNSSAFFREVLKESQGGTRISLKLNAMKKILVSIPSIEKQNQIADTLTSAQREIDLLKQLADKYKTQKRGLMQKMLTGEWRVKPEIVNQYMEA